MVFWRFLVHWTGSDYGAPYGHFVPYDFVSGIFGGSAFLTAAWVMLRRHNCEVHRCWRLGRHVVEGTGHHVCRRHNPEGSITAEHVRQRYHLYIGSRPGKG